MTLNDPLLKELKGHIGNLICSQTRVVGDQDELLILICNCLEAIFQKGISRKDGYTPWKTDCFQWFYQCIRKYHRVMSISFKLAFEDALASTKTKSHVGKTRLLIRSCLKRKCMHVPVEFHVGNEDYKDPFSRVTYDPENSILGHEILVQILLSLLLQLSYINFDLDLDNASFLDESWQIPTLEKIEVVPCTHLGLTLSFPLGYPIIIHIAENSVAAEISDKIQVGDAIDEINGCCMRNFQGSRLKKFFKKSRSHPMNIVVVKARSKLTNQLYLPIIKLYRVLSVTQNPNNFLNVFHSDPVSPEESVIQESDVPMLINLNAANKNQRAGQDDCDILLQIDDDPAQSPPIKSARTYEEAIQSLENLYLSEIDQIKDPCSSAGALSESQTGSHGTIGTSKNSCDSSVISKRNSVPSVLDIESESTSNLVDFDSKSSSDENFGGISEGTFNELKQLFL